MKSLSNLADWDFYIRLGLRSPLAAVSQPLLGYYIHLQGMAHNVRKSDLEYRYVEQKYGRVRAQRGVTMDREAWLYYLSGLAFRSGDRLAATRLSAEFVGRYRHWLPRAPGLSGWRREQVRQLRARPEERELPLPPGWAEEARLWLAPYTSGWYRPTGRRAPSRPVEEGNLPLQGPEGAD